MERSSGEEVFLNFLFSQNREAKEHYHPLPHKFKKCVRAIVIFFQVCNFTIYLKNTIPFVTP